MTPDRFRRVREHPVFRHRQVTRLPATLTQQLLLLLPHHRNVTIPRRPLRSVYASTEPGEGDSSFAAVIDLSPEASVFAIAITDFGRSPPPTDT